MFEVIAFTIYIVCWCYVLHQGMNDVPQSQAELGVYSFCLLLAPVSAPYLVWHNHRGTK